MNIAKRENHIQPELMPSSKRLVPLCCGPWAGGCWESRGSRTPDRSGWRPSRTRSGSGSDWTGRPRPARSRWSTAGRTWRRGTANTCAALTSADTQKSIIRVTSLDILRAERLRYPTLDCSGNPIRMTIRWSAIWDPASSGMGIQHEEPWCKALWVREPSSSQDSWRMCDTHSMNSLGLRKQKHIVKEMLIIGSWCKHTRDDFTPVA